MHFSFLFPLLGGLLDKQCLFYINKRVEKPITLYRKNFFHSKVFCNGPPREANRSTVLILGSGGEKKKTGRKTDLPS
jgi:hypothetical protein